MFCSSEFWVIAALISWIVFVGTWMLARHQTKNRPMVETTVSSRRRVVTSGEAGGSSYLVYFRDSAGETQPVVVSKRTWKDLDTGDPIVVYKHDGRKEGYAHLSRPFTTANIPTRTILFVSFIGALFLPIVAAMAVTGTQLPECT